MAQMTGGEAMVQSLLRHGVDTVFGLPGVQMYALFEALAQTPQIRLMTSRHEQGAAYMAMGYAKATGRPGVYTVVPGPGVLNTTAALCTAWGGNNPVVCLTGQVPSPYLGRRRGQLHELPDQLATLATLTKWARRADRPADVPALMDEAFAQATGGRPGPVSLEICWDHLLKKEDVSLPPVPPPAPAPEVDPDALAQAAKLLAGAKRPLIWLGSGAQGASEAVLALAELLDAPVAAYRGGRGVLSAEHELSVTALAGYELWQDADVVVGIGTRLDLPYGRWRADVGELSNPTPPPHVIRVDIDPEEMTRLVPHAGLVADASTGAYALAEAVARLRSKEPGARDRVRAAKANAEKKLGPIELHKGYLDRIRAVLPRDGIFVDEMCQSGYAAYLAWDVYEPRTYITAGFQGTLGYGYPTALGVKAGRPDKPVVSVTGDGGFLFGMSELATAVQEQLPVVTIVFNNGAFGNVARDQEERYGRAFGSELRNPDFVKIAEGFGMAGYRAGTPAALQKALEQALAADAPALIEVPVDRTQEGSPWPLLFPNRM